MQQKHLKAATVLSLIGVIVFLGYRAIENGNSTTSQESRLVKPDAETLAKREALKQMTLGTINAVPRDQETALSNESSDSGNDSSLSSASRSLNLRVGVIGATPERTEITSLTAFPHSRAQVRKLYANARDRACRLLVPGVAVEPPVARASPGQSGTLGRQTVLTIGLEFDSSGPKKLPAVTRGQVNSYLGAHRLAVQPTLYHDVNGRPYFGTDCQAAFYELNRPGLTVKAEPMIETAVARFRALGIVGGASAGNAGSALLGRTLALAFTFAQKDETITGASDMAKTTTELLLLHLTPDSTADDPEINVFVTSDERTNLHRLETRGMRLNSPVPTISSDIQFNRTILMGMYPADPVVSGIRYRSAAILSMETIKRLSDSDADRSALSLTEILDQFGKLAGSAL